MPNVKATKALQKRSDQALDAFNKYYAGIWGEERWHDSLFPAMNKPTRYSALINQYANTSNVETLLCKDGENDCEALRFGSSENPNGPPLVYVKTSENAFPPPIPVISADSGSRLYSHWNMDAASVIAAHMLGVKPGDKVLDLCAAPGGKSIVLAQMLWPGMHAEIPLTGDSDAKQEDSNLHSNEFDKTRNARLESNLKSYLPQTLLTDNYVKVLRIDGSEKSAAADLPLGEDGYDKVLLDAPCSSERHIIHAYVKANASGQIADEMSNWKSSHSKTLAKTQLALLLTAVKAVKIGGSILYATCSISHEENDDVVERVLDALKRDRKKSSGAPTAWRIKVEISSKDETQPDSVLDSMTEKTKYGRIALPDHPAGGRWGPLYFCTLKKVPRDSKVTSKEVSDTE